MKYAYPVIITSLDHSRRTTKQYTKAGRIHNIAPKYRTNNKTMIMIIIKLTTVSFEMVSLAKKGG